MQLNQLEALLAVLEQGSFAAAARTLGRRRSTLQTQVEALESELGGVLLVRSPHGTTATRAGEAFADRARRLLADAEALRGSLGAHPERQVLRIALQPGVPPNLLVLCNQILAMRMPDCCVEAVVCSPDEAMANPLIDLIWQFCDALPAGGHRTFVTNRYPIRLLASPTYLDARGRPASIDELAQHDLLAWTGHRAERGTLWPRVDGPEFPVSPSWISNDTHLVRTLAGAGRGIALVADAPQVQGTLVGEALEPVLDGVVGEEGRARLLIPDRAVHAPAVRAVAQLAREIGLGDHDLPVL